MTNKKYTTLKLLINWKKEKELCEQSFEAFVKSAWHTLEPNTPLEWNWHLSYLCKETETQIRRIGAGLPRQYHLCVNVPPSSLKTMIFTRMANAWAWIHWPWIKFLSTSYSTTLSETHSLDTLTLIKHEWYQRYWGNKFHINPKQETKGFFRTNYMGERFISSTGATITGMHGNIIIADDLLNPKSSISEADLRTHKLYWTRTLPSRFCNPAIDMFWVVQQRLCQDDTTGLILNFEKDKYKLICLPAEDREWVSPPELRKNYINGLLFPSRMSKEYLDDIKKKDPVAYAAQYLQKPSPEEGEIFKRKNWKFWIPKGANLPPVNFTIGNETYTCDTIELPLSFDDTVCSWDFAFKDKKTSDNVCGEVWASSGNFVFLLDEKYGKMDYAKSCSEMIDLKNKWPLTTAILVEDEANGPAIISQYKSIVNGIKPIKATKTGNPRTRALVVSKLQTAGKIILPHPNLPNYKWVNSFIDEYADYTGMPTDKNDRVAAGCQAIVYLTQGKPVFEYYDYKMLEVKTDWQNLKPEMQLFCSVWMEENLNTSTIIALWNQRTGHMAILDEFISSTPMPEIIKAAISVKMSRITNGIPITPDTFTWIGNPTMFSRKDGSLRGLKTSAIKSGVNENYIKAGINIQDNISFEEKGAITTTDKMFQNKMIFIDKRASETARQPAAWFMENGKPAEGYGCARALINLCSFVYEESKKGAAAYPIGHYTEEKEAIDNFFNRNPESEELGKFINQKPDFVYYYGESNDNIEDRYSWMI